MARQPSITPESELRARAEERVGARTPDRDAADESERTRLLHELQVHQAELELQNEELRRVQVELETSRDRYQELYDQAPVGYLTLDRSGRVCQANLAAAHLLRMQRHELVGRRLSSFMSERDGDCFHRHRQRVFVEGVRDGCELSLRDNASGSHAVQLESARAPGVPGAPALCRTAVIDLSDLKRAQERLRTQQSRNRAILETAVDAIVTINARGIIEDFNPAAERVFGYRSSEVLGQNVRMLMPAPYREEHQSYLERYLKTGKGCIIGQEAREVTGLRKDGTEFPLSLGLGHWWDQGEPRFTAILRDISERKQDEERLRRDAQFIRQLIDTAQAIILVLDNQGRIVLLNPFMEKLSGYRLDEVRGRDWFSTFLPERDRERIRELFGQALQAHEVRGNVNPIVTKDGREREIEWHGKPLKDPEGRVTAILSVGHDITALVDRQRRLEESEARFRQIAEVIEDAFYLLESDHTVSYVSPGYERIWQRPAADADRTRAQWLNSVHPDDVERLEGAHANALRGDPFDEEYRIARPDGSPRWVHDRVFPVLDAEGRTQRYVGIAQDITEARELEAELAHAQKMEAIGTLASGVAHDFRNLLQGISGCAHMALRKSDPEHTRRYVRRIAEAAKHGAALTDQLMSFSHRQEVEPQRTLVDEAIQHSATLVERLLGEQITLELKPHAPRASMMVHPVQLEQILMNLASNAVDAMPRGGRLSIESHIQHVDERQARRLGTVKPGPHIQLIVRDTGAGMDERTRTRVFEPFFTTKEVGRGTGLGLSTVFAITRRLGGCVEVQSKPGRGTAFIFHFPQCAGGTPAPRTEPSTAFNYGATALLVEDNPLVRLSVRDYLEELGLEVLEAATGDEALALYEQRTRPVDLLVSDVVMPGLSGPQLASRLRQRDRSLRVLLISARSPAELADQGAGDGDVALLRKPFGREDLARTLASLIGDHARKPISSCDKQTSRESAGPTPTADAARQTRRPRILIVEDDEPARIAIRDLLSDLGYDAIAYERPSAALAAARRQKAPIDLLLTDLHLAEMDGDELALELTKSRPRMQVVFMSGLPDRSDRVDGEFLQKPIDLADLEALVRRMAPVRPVTEISS